MLARVFLLLCCSLLLCSSASAQSVCRALALSGGGDKAAYEAGVLQGLFENQSAEEYRYDVVTGISAGSTLSAALTMFNKGDELSALKLILSILANLNQSSIYTQWEGGVVAGLLFHSSFFDSTPLRNLFERELSPYSVGDRDVCMGITSLSTGLYEAHCDFQSVQQVITTSLASAAIPGVFIPQTIGNETYVDGGTVNNVDCITAVERCLAQGFAQENIVLDVVECGGASISPVSDAGSYTTIPLLLRSLSIRSTHGSEPSLQAAQLAYPNVQYRYHIYPSVPISGSGIDFNPEQMKQMIELGNFDAQNAINAAKAAAAKQ